MKAHDLARLIEETSVGQFAILLRRTDLLGRPKEYFAEITADRKKIADALRFYGDRYEAAIENVRE